jgi:hypothetical protein
MLEPSQNGGYIEWEIKNMGIGPMTLMSEDVSLNKHIVYKRGITTKEDDFVPLQVCCPPK